jgi:cobalt-zinc-cadmium efflux system outer membrane protein
VDRLGENLALARQALAAGKIGLLEFSIVRRDLVETRLAYLDALAEAVTARAALVAAIGAEVE